MGVIRAQALARGKDVYSRGYYPVDSSMQQRRCAPERQAGAREASAREAGVFEFAALSAFQITGRLPRFRFIIPKLPRCLRPRSFCL